MTTDDPHLPPHPPPRPHLPRHPQQARPLPLPPHRPGVAMSEPRRPDLSNSPPEVREYRDALRAYNLRVAQWLGLDPAQVFRLDVDDSRAQGSVTEPPRIIVEWEAVERQQPSRGYQQFVNSTWFGDDDEPPRYSAEIVVEFPDVRELMTFAGDKPKFPVPANWPADWPRP